MFRDKTGENIPFNDTESSLKTADFFNTHPVFSLNEADEMLGPKGGRSATLERLKYHMKTGRLKLVKRGVYAVVPPGIPFQEFQPDPFLSGAAIRPDAIFSHHSALELQGVAHSFWQRYTLYTQRRRRPLQLNGAEIQFLGPPGAMRTKPCIGLGTRRVEYRGKLLQATGPERTLVEGFRSPDRVGGLSELVESAGGFSVLDLDLLQEILHCYDTAYLWAATGWFLERHRRSFHVSQGFLDALALQVPRAPQYLDRNLQGGTLVKRWNLFLPKAVTGEPDEYQS